MERSARERPGRRSALTVSVLSLVLLPGCIDLSRPSAPPVTQDGDVSDGGTSGEASEVADASDSGDGLADAAAGEPGPTDGAADGNPDLPVRSGLVAYWPLNEGVGIHLEDITHNENDGQALNGASWVDTGLPPPLAGNRSALRFDGVNDYAIVGTTGIPSNEDARTVSLWVNITSAAPSQHFIVLTNGYSASLELGLRAGVLAAMGWNSTVFVSTAAPTRGVWHHIVHTYENSTNKLYVDGVLRAMVAATKQAAPTFEAWLGSARGRGFYFGGLMDDVRIYDRALSAAEIADLFGGAAAVVEPGQPAPVRPIADLKGYWKLDETTAGTVLTDSSGFNNVGIPVNRPTPNDPVSTVVFANPHSLSFSGNQCARLGNATAINFNGPITLSAWIFPTINTGLRQIIGHGPADNAEVSLRLDNGSYQILSNDGQMHLAGFAIPQEDIATWIHLVGSYDGNVWRLYRNGRQVANSVDAVGAVPVNGNWAIGGSGSCDGRFFQGNIDDVRLYQRGLSPQEIDSIARGQI